MAQQQFLPEGMKPAHGLYDPHNEHDACGIGLYANINNKKSHEIVTRGLDILRNLEHRGAVGADIHRPGRSLQVLDTGEDIGGAGA